MAELHDDLERAREDARRAAEEARRLHDHARELARQLHRRGRRANPAGLPPGQGWRPDPFDPAARDRAGEATDSQAEADGVGASEVFSLDGVTAVHINQTARAGS